MQTQLTGPHRATFNAVFQHPIAANLKWIDVKAMLVAVADTVQENTDVFKATRNGKFLVLRRPRRSGLEDIAELMKVRHFLEQSDVVAPKPVAEDGTHLLVVIDHRLARIYRTEMHGSVPQRITLHDPTGSGRHLHNVENYANGQRKPEQKNFYEAIARAIHGARKILLFGSGTGASSAMEALLAELKRNHHDLATRVVGSIVVDEQHLTENQLLAKAREHYEKAAP